MSEEKERSADGHPEEAHSPLAPYEAPRLRLIGSLTDITRGTSTFLRRPDAGEELLDRMQNGPK